MEKKRIEWIDVAKGIGMIFVQMGHTYFPDIIINWLYSFHMPLFFFLSGVTYRGGRYNFKEYFFRKIKTILIPYVLFCIISILNAWILQAMSGGINLHIKSTIGSILLNFPQRPYWFFVCLFLSEMIYFCLNKIIVREKKQRKIMILLICILIAILNDELIKIFRLPLCIDLIPTALAFICLGDMLSKYIKNEKRSFIIIPVMLIMNILMTIVNLKLTDQKVDMVVNRYGNYGLFMIGAILGCIFVVECAKLLCRYTRNKTIKNILVYIGVNSAVFYGLHQLINAWVDRILARVLPFYKINDFCVVLSAIILMVITFSVISTIVILYNKTIKKIIDR